MDSQLDRRFFLKSTAVAAAVGAFGNRVSADNSSKNESTSSGEHRGRIYKSIKFNMFREKGSYAEKFRALKEIGFDGVELDSPGGQNKKEALAASREVGLPIHGVVDSIHWGTRLSDPKAETRQKGLEGLLTAIRESHAVGGNAVLLVPGQVTNPKTENQKQVWERSIEQIRKALPTASQLGIHILIENVWNGFCYTHDGPDDQTADQLAAYIDAADSPWVGVYFDIGNHQKYGKPADWIRTLGRRIVKLDVKDWGKKNSFCRIGDGDVDWADVRRALSEIRFTGWSTAEVSGGDRERMKDVARRMDVALGL